jgi:transposase
MGQPISITRSDHTSAELRSLAAKSRDGATVRRLLAIAAVLDGRSRAEAAAAGGMQRQTLPDWIHRYNAEGLSGLTSRVGPGRPPRLSKERKARLRDMVLEGPDPDRNEVVRWRCVDLRDEIASQWSVTVHVRTVAKWLHDLNMTRLQPRPIHPARDPEAETAFKKISPKA